MYIYISNVSIIFWMVIIIWPILYTPMATKDQQDLWFFPRLMLCHGQHHTHTGSLFHLANHDSKEGTLAFSHQK